MTEQEYYQELIDEGYSHQQAIDIIKENEYWKDIMDNL